MASKHSCCTCIYIYTFIFIYAYTYWENIIYSLKQCITKDSLTTYVETYIKSGGNGSVCRIFQLGGSTNKKPPHLWHKIWPQGSPTVHCLLVYSWITRRKKLNVHVHVILSDILTLSWIKLSLLTTLISHVNWSWVTVLSTGKMHKRTV